MHETLDVLIGVTASSPATGASRKLCQRRHCCNFKHRTLSRPVHTPLNRRCVWGGPSHTRHTCRAQKLDSKDEEGQINEEDDLAALRNTVLPNDQPKRRKRQADSSDWVSSQLTRRFGLAGGLVWLGILSFGVVSEQVKTRLENRTEEQGTQDVANATEVDLGLGLKYKDLRVGGGAAVQRGYLNVLHYKGYADGKLFEDTKERGKPIVFLYGSRPFTAGLCLGVEKGMQGMKAGGIRQVTVPPSLGFGENGINLRGTLHAPDKTAQEPIDPQALLKYELELIRVSIPPT